MGLIRGLVLLPLAPVAGVVWIADRLADEAERQLHDDGALRLQLADLAAAYDRGEISADEYDRIEEELLRQMQPTVQRLDSEDGR
ncbi:MAG TPA: gas vesicle protein GvpG [Mycobacteriales bacterium]|nr:gas vesicle protein GvpG [Mycobacteriales bacterium]